MAARRIGSASLQRLLGNWQHPASRIPAYPHPYTDGR